MGPQRALSVRDNAEGARKIVERKPANSFLKAKNFSTVLPVCARCKRIRDGTGGWRNELEHLENHFQRKYTHTLCPPCAKKLYPELFGKKPTGLGI